ncbi:MAG: NAD-dependent epimerase [Desulfurivibrionaceae bacterium]
MNTKKVLITGVAGFIGYFLARRLLTDSLEIVGIDNLNDYYDPGLKRARLEGLNGREGFTFVKGDLADRALVEKVFRDHDFDVVVNLAAQAGVRYSLENPHSYVDSNVTGFLNVLEGCRHGAVKHLVFASSSSVYGGNTRLPYSVHDKVDHPVSLYAATKKTDELMAHTYAHLYGIPATGLRFFTVYGPWGRPDMAYFLFTRAILAGEPINVFNHGRMKRDFTYIDDIIEGVVRVMDRIPQSDSSWDSEDPDPATSYCPYRIYNIGNNNSEDLMRFIEVLESCLGRKAEKRFLDMQPGDVQATYADISDLARDTGFQPSTPIEEGLKKFAEWYQSYYHPQG